MATNPLIGASWGGPNGQQAGMPNPLAGAPVMPGGMGMRSPAQSAGAPTAWGNPGGFQNPLGPNEINRNMGLTNIMAGQMKNALAPQWSQLMNQYGGQAGGVFGQLANLGSPYYQQKQTEAFTQGQQQNQNAGAMARQQLAAQGYGNTPSGAEAAMIGGMAQSGAQSMSEQYLQNLFQNEQMQLAGAQGLQGMAQLYNPNQLLSGTSVGASVQPQPSFFQNLNSVMGGIGQMFGGYGSTGLPGA